MENKKDQISRRYPLILILITITIFMSCGDSKKNAVLSKYLMPDLILFNGKIITVDSDDSIAEAVAIKGKKIIAVGSNKEIKKLVGNQTQVFNLKGKTATPGLIDAHCHFASGGTGMLYILDVSFPSVRNIDDILKKVKTKAKMLKPGEWIYGRGWDEGKLEERRYIYASDLDQVSPDNPVWLMHTMGHYGTANTEALRLANITKHTPDPPGGTIDKDSNGNPTGVLKESAMSMVTKHIPPITSEQIQEGIRKLAKAFNKEGMTAAKEPGIDRRNWTAYQKILAQDELTVRMFILWSGGKTTEYAKKLTKRISDFTKPYLSTGDDRLISGGVKLYLDGSGGARTAWLYEEWNKNFKDIDKGNYGYPVIDPKIFRKMVKIYHNAGLHLGVHAIGDRAIDWLMESYYQAFKEKPIIGLRHSIIHCNIPTQKALNLMAEMQKVYDAGYPEAEAVHLWWIGDTYAGNFGPERSLKLKPYKTFLNMGIKWAATSDFFVDPFPARYGIWAQIAREPLLGVYGEHPFGTEESVDVRTALKAYTKWAAHQIFLEDKIGSIEVGKYADIAVWDKDIYTIPTDEIKDINCILTLFAGKIVYRDESAPIEKKEN